MNIELEDAPAHRYDESRVLVMFLNVQLLYLLGGYTLLLELWGVWPASGVRR